MATNVIAINRGDSFDFTIAIADGYDSYYLEGNDAIYLGIMDPNDCFENALIKKKITLQDDESSYDGYVDKAGNVIIHLMPEDTVDMMPGRYFYMLKLKQDHIDREDPNIYYNGVKTIVNKTKFVIYD